MRSTAGGRWASPDLLCELVAALRPDDGVVVDDDLITSAGVRSRPARTGPEPVTVGTDFSAPLTKPLARSVAELSAMPG